MCLERGGGILLSEQQKQIEFTEITRCLLINFEMSVVL